jgi:seryl-tRNA synthetase
MLDLGFVRANLEVVEGKLRARGADPAALLGDFRALDQSRREAITTSERLKARRNELSQRVGVLKKAGPASSDAASALMDETRALKSSTSWIRRRLRWTSSCGFRWRAFPTSRGTKFPTEHQRPTTLR